MFTGLIETTGTVRSLTPSPSGTRILIEAGSQGGSQTLAARLRPGDSVSVSGVCLTAIDPTATTFTADLAQETLERTTLGRLHPGTTVNLEAPTPAGSPLGGHVVQGHVDGTATLLAIDAIHPSHLHSTDWRMALRIPAELARNVVQQGSITVEGISLTVALLRPEPDGSARVEIAVIPHTWKSTSLRTLQPGDSVNIETDVLARYAAQQALSASATATEAVSQPRNEWLPDARRDTTPPPEAAPELSAADRKPWLTTAYLLANGY